MLDQGRLLGDGDPDAQAGAAVGSDAAGGYRAVVRDRAFLQLAGTSVAVIAVGWGAFTWLLPPFARTEAGLSTPLIGLLLLANAGCPAAGAVTGRGLRCGRRRGGGRRRLGPHARTQTPGRGRADSPPATVML